MEKDPNKRYDELMAAFESGDAEAAQDVANGITREIKEDQNQKELPPTIIEGEVE